MILGQNNILKWRILVPSASVPPSTGTPGLWRRISGTGAVDAQGLGLIHPMTWIDERLFGWSRSAKRGTSAWSGNLVDETSRVGTPDDTDEEDTGDYDNVIGVLPNDDDHATGQKPQSRQSSYADLQKIRHSAHPLSANVLTISTTVDQSDEDPTRDEGLRLRQSHRTRRESLSDRVPVTRIAAVDKKETFPLATQSLNDEIDKTKVNE